MKTLQSMAKEYIEKQKFSTGTISDLGLRTYVGEAWEAGYIEGFRDLLTKDQELNAKEHSRKMNLERVFSFHTQIINLIERSMKELE